MSTKILAYLSLVVACAVACGQTTTGATDAAMVIVEATAPVAQPTDVEPPPPAPPPKVDTRTPAQKLADAKRDAIAACRGSDGSWHCNDPKNKNGQIAAPLMASSGNATAAQCGPACTVGAWWFDPANGTGCASDANSGTSATCAGAGIGPLATFAQYVIRVGSTSPQYPPGQSVSITQLSAQAANVDPIFLESKMSNGGQQILTIVPVAVGAPQSITRNTAKTRAAPGTLLTLTNPTGVVAGQLIVNTSTGSQAIVDSVGATTVMQQPMTTASVMSTAVLPAPVEDDTWNTGNTVQLYTLQNTNLKKWRVIGGDLSSTSVPTGAWVFTGAIADSSGAGTSMYIHSNSSATSVVANCLVNARFATNSEGGRNAGTFAVGDSFVQGVQTYAGEFESFGGGFANGYTLGAAGPALFANDVILHGTIKSNGGSLFLEAPGVYSDGTFIIIGNFVEIDSVVWGSYAVTLDPGGRWFNNTASTFVLTALLTNGTLKLGTATTGSYYTSSTGLWVGAVTLTPAHIDTNNTTIASGGALVEPSTGAGFSSKNGN